MKIISPYIKYTTKEGYPGVKVRQWHPFIFIPRFIYMVSSAAVTGTQNSFDSKVDYFNRINAMQLKNPRPIGSGISNKATLDTVCEYSSGAIVGSAFIKALNETQDVAKGVELLLKRLGE